MSRKSLIKFFKKLSQSKGNKTKSSVNNAKTRDNKLICKSDKSNQLKHVEYKDENNNVKIALIPEHMTVYSPTENFPFINKKDDKMELFSNSSLYTPSIMSIDEKYKSSSYSDAEDNNSDFEEDIIDSYTYDSDESDDIDFNIFKGNILSQSDTNKKSRDNMYNKYNYSPRSSTDSKFSKLFKRTDSINSIDSYNSSDSGNLYKGTFTNSNKKKLEYILEKDLSDNSSFFEKSKENVDNSDKNSIISDKSTLYDKNTISEDSFFIDTLYTS